MAEAMENEEWLELPELSVAFNEYAAQESADFNEILQFLAEPSVPSSTAPIVAAEWMVTDRTSGRLRAPFLYEFLLLLLQRPEYVSYASYKDRSQGLFEIHQPEEVAALWQQVRGRHLANDMTYDKFARAVRGYYKNDIMVKTNTRHTFRFSASMLQETLIGGNNNANGNGIVLN